LSPQINDLYRRIGAACPRAVACFSLLAGSGLASDGALGAEWSFSPSASIAVDADDNANLSSRTDQEEEISGFIGSVGLGVGYRSQLYEANFSPLLVSRRYPGDSDFDDDDQIVKAGLTRNTRNGSLSMKVDFLRDYIRTGERAGVDFDVEDPNDIDDDDSGRVGARVRRIKWDLRPSWNFRISDTSRMKFDLRHTDVDYDETAVTRLVDYNLTSARARYSRRLSERNTGVFEIGGFWYDAGEADNDSFSYGFRTGLQRRLSEKTSVEILGGAGTSERAEGGNKSNYLARVNVVRRLETIRLLAQYQRTVNGSGSGTLTARDQINLAIRRQLSELLTAGLGVVAYQTSSIEDDVDFDERTYVQLRSQFGWKLTRTLNLEANYRYTLIDRDDDDESANSNAITVWLRYRPNPTTISR
jgi:hypothetical protein